MKKTMLLCVLAVIGLSACAPHTENMSSSSTEGAMEYKRITAEQATLMIDENEEIIILDVRTESEFAEGHIKNAVLIPHTELEKQAPDKLTDLNAVILVYCRSGRRSELAAKKLIEMGYANVLDFGGIIE